MEEQNLNDLIKQIAALKVLEAKLKMQLAINKIKETTKNMMENIRTGLDNKIKATGVAIKEGSEQYGKFKEERTEIIDKYKEVQEWLNENHLEIMQEKELLIAGLESKMLTAIQEMNDIKNEKEEYSKNGAIEVNEYIKSNKDRVKELKAEAIREMKAGNFERVTEISNECSSLTSEIEKFENSKSEEFVRLNGNIDAKKEEIEEIKKQIEEIENQKNEAKKQYEEYSQELSGEKNTQLAVLNEKTPLFKRIANRFSSMFMSNKSKYEKVQEEVFKPASNSITKFTTEKIPEMAVGAVNKSKEFVQGIKDLAIKGKESFDAKLYETLIACREKLEDKVAKSQEELENSQQQGPENQKGQEGPEI